jgi:hypothetical protein
MMKARIEGEMLVVRVPLVTPPTLSKSGKTRLVATSHGVQRTSIKVEGKPIHVVMNAFIHAETPPRVRWQNVLDWKPDGKRNKKTRSDEREETRERETLVGGGADKR